MVIMEKHAKYQHRKTITQLNITQLTQRTNANLDLFPLRTLGQRSSQHSTTRKESALYDFALALVQSRVVDVGG